VEAYQAVAVYIVLALVEEHHPFQEEADQVEVDVVLVMEVQAFVLVTEVAVQVIVLVMEVVVHCVLVMAVVQVGLILLASVVLVIHQEDRYT